MNVKLVVREGKLAGKEIPIRTNQFVIGRDETCNLRPNSSVVSKLHCAIVIADDTVWLRDLKSTNGTFHNGERVSDRVPLQHGDKIAVGPLLFEVHMDRPAAPVAPAAAATSKPKERKGPKKPLPVDDSAVFEWLSEDDEIATDSDPGIDTRRTLADIAETETLPDLEDRASKSKRTPAPTQEQPKIDPQSKDSSSAAGRLLGGMFNRKRT